ncbi:MAG: phosphoenolpyruvate carboxylase [Verrucomicrobiae bacterium]|jgi:phosphoenolpyruvate carboxylase|nr:phosphoenolpyruvate carboxylase [Verrucomicrobiae bacterium]
MKHHADRKHSFQESHYLLDGFKKIDQDLHFLMLCFKEVLLELGEAKLAHALPWISTSEEAHSAQKGLEQAYSIAFQLLNIVEANAAEKTRRLREIRAGLTLERGLWGSQLLRLKKSGFSAQEIATFFSQVRVEPVFTAHPTEAKRGVVLEQHRILNQLLTSIHQEERTPLEEKKIREEIKMALEKLWRSGEIFLNQPKVSEERRGILFYFRSILPEALAHLDDRLEAVWEELDFPLELIASHKSRPRLEFGTWVGGDRDGHPFVTSEVTRETLAELRLSALSLLDRQLEEVARALPLSIHFQMPSEPLCKMIEQFKKELGEVAAGIITRYPEELWRQFVLLVQAKLPLAKNTFLKSPDTFSLAHIFHADGDEEADGIKRVMKCDDRGSSIECSGKDSSSTQHPYGLPASAVDQYEISCPVFFKTPHEVRLALELLAASLEEIHGERFVKKLIWPLLRSLDVFGFHLADLDIRQNSQRHDLVMQQILQAAKVPEADSFTQWEESKRLAFLRKELTSEQTLLKNKEKLPQEAEELLHLYHLLGEEIRNHGQVSLGSLIVSMTRRLSDLLVVIFLARQAGISRWNGETHYSLLPIVPLFETYEDLKHSPELLHNYLQEASGWATLLHQSKKTEPNAEPSLVQQIMIGYSDSNKDCGILASQWVLHESQRAMTEVGNSLNVAIRFFHGRGGTISRGAGPTHLFLEALPPGSLQGDLRMTEQGETIAQKYGTQSNATYHLELLLAGVTSLSLLNKKKYSKKESFQEKEKSRFAALIGSFLAEKSALAYRALITTEGFLTFYEQATPIDALEVSRIGSRPKRRSAQHQFSDLRSIPWVFSWNQARYFLPGWFGVGSALTALEQEDVELFKALQEHHRAWPFLNYVLLNVETNIASANLSMMKKYASLVTDQSIQEKLLTMITQEFEQTESQLHKVFGGSLQERRPRMGKTLALRAKGLELLHEQQIITLQSWRKAQYEDPIRAQKLLPRVLLSINAIASGLRTTG